MSDDVIYDATLTNTCQSIGKTLHKFVGEQMNRYETKREKGIAARAAHIGALCGVLGSMISGFHTDQEASARFISNLSYEIEQSVLRFVKQQRGDS